VNLRRDPTSATGPTLPTAVSARAPGVAVAEVPIVVLLGGPSAEHDVSIVSGSAVADALEDRGHPVERQLIDLAGRWWRLPTGLRGADRPAADYDDPAALGAAGSLGAGAALERMAAAEPAPLVFIALHGPFGEDGTVQALLDAVDLAYTGSGVTASAIGMDKAVFKRLVRGLGVPVVDWREVGARRWWADRAGVLGELEAFTAANGDPRLIVKPARLGSSVGMTLAHGPAERVAAIETALAHDTLALVERYVPAARELEVAVLGNDPAQLELYGPGEVLSGHEFYDYAAKYTPGLSRTALEPDLPAPLRATILKLARDVYRAIGAEGFARIDFLLEGERPWVSEINTIPGFTPISLFPTLPAIAGLAFGDVCERVVALGLERHAGRVRRRLEPGDLPR
jgi:D-alanine-D-alanine ligase